MPGRTERALGLVLVLALPLAACSDHGMVLSSTPALDAGTDVFAESGFDGGADVEDGGPDDASPLPTDADGLDASWSPADADASSSVD